MEKLFIPVLLGTARKDRESKKAADFIFSALEKRNDVETVCVDVAAMRYDATVPPWGEEGTNSMTTPWKETMERADGLFIVVPEYNRGYPGELKLALDSLYDEYEKKPVALCGVSSGAFGGSRVVEHIKPVLVELGLVPIRKALHISNVASAFDADGNPTDEKTHERLGAVTGELLWFAWALREGRLRT